jgi:hypothetical protein
MKYYKEIFSILIFIFVSCKDNETTENVKTLESTSSTSGSTKEINSADFVQKKSTYLFEYSDDNSNQFIEINIIDKKTIKFHLVTETLPCDTEYSGIAENKFWDGDGEIDEDSEGGYFVDEYFKEEKEFLIGIRLAEDFSKVKIKYIQKDSLNTDCLPITQKIMKRIN